MYFDNIASEKCTFYNIFSSVTVIFFVSFHRDICRLFIVAMVAAIAKTTLLRVVYLSDL